MVLLAIYGSPFPAFSAPQISYTYMTDTPIKVIGSEHHPFIRASVGERTVLGVIALNVVAVFISEFPSLPETIRTFFEWIDYVCVVYFVFEAAVKIRVLSFAEYWRNSWNKLDFLIVLAGIPLLMNPPFLNEPLGAFAIAPLLRMGRFLRFIRVMRFMPNAAHIWKGIVRALQASVGVFAVLLGLNLILAMGANLLFGDSMPEYFGNPIISAYTLFKVFTVEGWYEIPDLLAEGGAPMAQVWTMRLYFILTVLMGGILGLSLANAVFVDEMTTDNNDELEEMVAELRKELQIFREEFQASVGEQITSTTPDASD